VSPAAGSILIFGATGYTGTLIARELDSMRIPFTIASRNEARGRALQAQLRHATPLLVADVMAPDSVARALDRAAIAINCVGPYNLFGSVLIDASRDRELVYIDLSGEQEVIRRSIERSDREGPSTILHSIAFESALADLLAAEMVDPEQKYARIASYYSFKANRPSPGTYLTMKCARLFQTYRVRAGRLEPAEPLSFDEACDVEGQTERVTAVFVPYPEVLFWARHKACEASSFLLMNSSEAALVRATRTAQPADLALIMEQHRRRRREGPSEAEREGQAFTLTVRAVSAGGRESMRRIEGRDMYRLSALLVVQVIEFLVDGGTLQKGALTPAALPVWSGVWARLQDQGLIAAREEFG
jgi:short subunit dehydrogenase-like uncharacterized protein